MTSKEIELIKEMLKMQDKLDKAIMKEYGLTEIKWKDLELAILDEIGELTHELKGAWCWWKKSQPKVDKNKVLGELVDVWHFVLSYTYNFSEVRFTRIDWIIDKGINLCQQEGLACLLVSVVNAENMDKLFYLIAISMCLEFSIEDVYQAYCDKNKVNYQRLKEGY